MKGAHNPGKESAGQVSLKHIFEIAKIKRSVRCFYLFSSSGGHRLQTGGYKWKADVLDWEDRKNVSLVSP